MRRLSLTASLLIFCTARCVAWDYEGHRTVNQLALAALPPEFPAFAKTDNARERIAFLAGEPDRWYNSVDKPLRHLNAPDHFIDFEDLEPAGLSAATVSEFRHIYTAQLALGRAAHPERFPKIDPERNKDRTRELAGYLPWAITEHYGKLKSAFSYLKTFEESGGTSAEIANAQANAIYIMGTLGHYVGDGAQPLHTTKHYNGWVGDNPQNFTTARTFHAWIDGGFLNKTGGLSLDALTLRVKPAQRLATTADQPRDPIFNHAMNYLLAQFPHVEPLYTLEKTGKLTPEKPESKEGRAFLEAQILTAAHTLGNFWLTAWQEAPPDTFLRASLLARQAKTAK